MSILGSIAKVALPAIGSLIPGLGSIASKAVGLVGKGVADSLSTSSAKQATEMDFKQQQQLQNEFNAFSAEQAQKQMDFQKESATTAMEFSDSQATRQMEFQERMSSTAHQREIEDLRAAGINPILSAKYGGSSTPSGASGSGVTSSGAQPSDLQSPAQTKASATQARQARLQEQALQAEIDLKRAQATATMAEAGYKEGQTKQINYRMEDIVDNAIAKTAADIGHISSQENINRLESILMTEIKLPSGQIDIDKAKLMLEELEMKLEVLRGPEGRNFIIRELGAKGGAIGSTYTTINNIFDSAISNIKRLIKEYGTVPNQVDNFLKGNK